MKKIIKDRKTLTLGLCLILICIFTLTVAYSALSVVLTINGNARVSAANWDIYLNNPRVTSGSATTNLPQIKTSSTLEFETTLNMPGDFYEFVVDVVNGGDIDAMIENVVKTPDLTTEQAKFLKYEITYQNNEPITTKQLLAKDTTMPIKVRIEYRKDLIASDLPTGQVVLDLALTLEYIQSDGTGTSVNNNGVQVVKIVSGDGKTQGDEVCVEDQCFYVMFSDESSVTMLSKYNLYVGHEITYDNNGMLVRTELSNPIIKQDSRAFGQRSDVESWIATEFYNEEYHGDYFHDYSGSRVEKYTEDYSSYLKTFGLEIISSRIIDRNDLYQLEIINEDGSEIDYEGPDWLRNTSFWTSYVTDIEESYMMAVCDYTFVNTCPGEASYFGVRPVIVISKDYF